MGGAGALPLYDGGNGDVIGGKLTTFGLCDNEPFTRSGAHYVGSRYNLKNFLYYDLIWKDGQVKTYEFDVTDQCMEQAHGGILTVWIDVSKLTPPDPNYGDILRIAFMYKFGRVKMKDLVSLLGGRDLIEYIKHQTQILTQNEKIINSSSCCYCYGKLQQRRVGQQTNHRRNSHRIQRRKGKHYTWCPES